MSAPGTSQRFRVELERADGMWDAKVYDLDDHGNDMLYAGVAARSLEDVLAQAMHYVRVAAAIDADAENLPTADDVLGIFEGFTEADA